MKMSVLSNKKILRTILWIQILAVVVPAALAAASQTRPNTPELAGRRLEIGPIDSLTSRWYTAPRQTAVPLAVPLRFKLLPGNRDDILWSGAVEVERRPFASIAEVTLAAPGPHEVTVTYTAAGERVTERATLLATDAAMRVVAIDVHTEPLAAAQIATPAAARATFFRDDSIAELQQVDARRYLTSTRRWLELTARVEPPEYAPLVEWRHDGLAREHAGAIGLRVFAPGRHTISAGPASASAATFIDAYRVDIVSHEAGDEVAEGLPVTFRAVTEPAGHEDRITWLASSRHGSASPTLAQGPEMTVIFDNTYAAAGRWLGVRADQATFERDGKALIRPGRQDEVAIRSETNLGRPSRAQEDVSEDPWLTTSSARFVNIKKIAFLRSQKTVNGLQMTSSFVAETPTQVAIHFSAEAFVEELPLPVGAEPEATGNRKRLAAIGVDGPSRMFVRALVDGQPSAPRDVVFAVGQRPGGRSFIFTTEVESGIHTVEMQWLVDPPRQDIGKVVGHLRDASLMIRQGRVDDRRGSLAVRTAPSGVTLEEAPMSWTPIPDMSQWIHVPADGVLTASFSAESFSTDEARLALRARVGGQPMLPEDVIFAHGSRPQARAMTFAHTGLPPGDHLVTFEWLADGNGTVALGDRSLALAAFPTTAARPTHPVRVLSGVQDTTDTLVREPIPGMETEVWIPDNGNGEVAVMFSAEVKAEATELGVGLRIDGRPIDDSQVSLTVDGDEAEVRSWIFDVKKLTPGLHTIAVDWQALDLQTGLRLDMGDRTLAAIAEVGALPDLAEAVYLGTGRNPHYRDGMLRPTDNITGLEPVIGARDVLLILWDARRPDQPDRDEPGYGVAELRDAVFGAAPSARDYFEVTSGGRFTLRMAGVVGWLDNQRDPQSAYWNHPRNGDGVEICSGGYRQGAVERASEAVQLAGNAGFPFADYDLDADGSVDASELAIVVIYPQNGWSGRARQPVLAQQRGCGTTQNLPLEVDGVVVEDVVECFGCSASRFMIIAHELGHQALGLDDMYPPRDQSYATQASWKALMAIPKPFNTTILGPAHRLALGWATPRIVEDDGVYAILDTKLGDQVLVLPRYNSILRDEYFLLENRQQGLEGHYDDSLGGCDGCKDRGIGVWHIAEEISQRLRTPIGVDPALWTDTDIMPFTQARQAIRLLRPWRLIDAATGIAQFSEGQAFWDRFDDPLLSADCPILIGPNPAPVPVSNTLTWADCMASGYNVEVLSSAPAGATATDPLSTVMSMAITID